MKRAPSRSQGFRWGAIFTAYLSALSCSEASRAENQPTIHVFYEHGRIVEDQGINAVSPEFGRYEYTDIIARLEASGFEVHSSVRRQNADVIAAANRVATQIKQLLRSGVPPENITVIGASKGAYIATLVANEMQDPGMNYVILAGCSSGTVEYMLENHVQFSGRVLAIRDRSDELAGSCEAAVVRSENVSEYEEIVLDLNVRHALIYKARDEWVQPTINWARHRAHSPTSQTAPDKQH